jgi:hypothetical protein
MARNTAFIPATPPGEISKLIIATHADDEAFWVLLLQQQASINMAYLGATDSTISEMFLRPIQAPTGPHAILIVMHAHEAAKAQVVCIHALRIYTMGSLAAVGTDPSVEGKAFGFTGEIFVEEGMTTLPQCLQQPERMADLVLLQQTVIPTEATLNAAFAIQDASPGGNEIEDLVNANGTATDYNLPKILLIPMILYPVLAISRSPRATLKAMADISRAMPEADRLMFRRNIQFFRASCAKTDNTGNNKSRTSSAWIVAPSIYPLFSKWQRDTMRGLYFGLIAGPGVPNALESGVYIRAEDVFPTLSYLQ